MQHGQKVPAIYLNDDTHKAIAEYAELSGSTINRVCKTILDDMQPVIVEMIKAVKEIQQGKDKQAVLEKYLENTIEIATKDLDNE